MSRLKILIYVFERQLFIWSNDIFLSYSYFSETGKSQSPYRAGVRNKKLKVDKGTGWKEQVTFGFRNHFIGKM